MLEQRDAKESSVGGEALADAKAEAARRRIQAFNDRASAGDFFLGKNATIADVAVHEVFDFFERIVGAEQLQKILAPYPKLRANIAATARLGRLQRWVRVERPSVFLGFVDYATSVNSTLQRTSR